MALGHEIKRRHPELPLEADEIDARIAKGIHDPVKAPAIIKSVKSKIKEWDKMFGDEGLKTFLQKQYPNHASEYRSETHMEVDPPAAPEPDMPLSEVQRIRQSKRLGSLRNGDIRSANQAIEDNTERIPGYDPARDVKRVEQYQQRVPTQEDIQPENVYPQRTFLDRDEAEKIREEYKKQGAETKIVPTGAFLQVQDDQGNTIAQSEDTLNSWKPVDEYNGPVQAAFGALAGQGDPLQQFLAVGIRDIAKTKAGKVGEDTGYGYPELGGEVGETLGTMFPKTATSGALLYGKYVTPAVEGAKEAVTRGYAAVRPYMTMPWDMSKEPGTHPQQEASEELKKDADQMRATAESAAVGPLPWELSEDAQKELGGEAGKRLGRAVGVVPQVLGKTAGQVGLGAGATVVKKGVEKGTEKTLRALLAGRGGSRASEAARLFTADPYALAAGGDKAMLFKGMRQAGRTAPDVATQEFAGEVEQKLGKEVSENKPFLEAAQDAWTDPRERAKVVMQHGESMDSLKAYQNLQELNKRVHDEAMGNSTRRIEEMLSSAPGERGKDYRTGMDIVVPLKKEEWAQTLGRAYDMAADVESSPAVRSIWQGKSNTVDEQLAAMLRDDPLLFGQVGKALGGDAAKVGDWDKLILDIKENYNAYHPMWGQDVTKGARTLENVQRDMGASVRTPVESPAIIEPAPGTATDLPPMGANVGNNQYPPGFSQEPTVVEWDASMGAAGPAPKHPNVVAQSVTTPGSIPDSTIATLPNQERLRNYTGLRSVPETRKAVETLERFGNAEGKGPERASAYGMGKLRERMNLDAKEGIIGTYKTSVADKQAVEQMHRAVVDAINQGQIKADHVVDYFKGSPITEKSGAVYGDEAKFGLKWGERLSLEARDKLAADGKAIVVVGRNDAPDLYGRAQFGSKGGERVITIPSTGNAEIDAALHGKIFDRWDAEAIRDLSNHSAMMDSSKRLAGELNDFLGSSRAIYTITLGRPGFSFKQRMEEASRVILANPGANKVTDKVGLILSQPMKKSGVPVTLGGRTFDAGELHEMIRRQGGLGFGRTSEIMGLKETQPVALEALPWAAPEGSLRAKGASGARTLNDMLVKPGEASSAVTDRLFRKAFKGLPEDVGSEDAIRAWATIAAINNGAAPNVATAMANRLLVNFADKSAAQTATRSFVPFTKWIASSLDGAVDIASKHPGRYKQLYNLMRAEEELDAGMTGKSPNAKFKDPDQLAAANVLLNTGSGMTNWQLPNPAGEVADTIKGLRGNVNQRTGEYEFNPWSMMGPSISSGYEMLHGKNALSQKPITAIDQETAEAAAALHPEFPGMLGTIPVAMDQEAGAINPELGLGAYPKTSAAARMMFSNPFTGTLVPPYMKGLVNQMLGLGNPARNEEESVNEYLRRQGGHLGLGMQMSPVTPEQQALKLRARNATDLPKSYGKAERKAQKRGTAHGRE